MSARIPSATLVGSASSRFAVRVVLVTPGATQLTVNPRGARYSAAERVRPMTAALAPAYSGPAVGLVRRTATLDTVTMRPYPGSSHRTHSPITGKGLCQVPLPTIMKCDAPSLAHLPYRPRRHPAHPYRQRPRPLGPTPTPTGAAPTRSLTLSQGLDRLADALADARLTPTHRPPATPGPDRRLTNLKSWHQLLAATANCPWAAI